MRSSKKRSRSGPNRPRPVGNIVNRVFDSSGPEGKVRGTPQQIIEKYQTLARDAQLGNDRVAAENFLQHAEHYTRLLAEAQRELAAEQEARQQQQQQQQQQHGSGNGGMQGGREREGRESGREREGREVSQQDRQQDRQVERAVEPVPGSADSAELIDLGRGESGLVELPEGRTGAPRRSTRSTMQEKPDRRDEGDRPSALARATAAAPARAIEDAAPARGPREPETDTGAGAPAHRADTGTDTGADTGEGAVKTPARRPRRPRTPSTKPPTKVEAGEATPDTGTSA